MGDVTIHTLMYSKADLERAPSDERIFFLMATSVANDTQMLVKALAVILQGSDHDLRLVNQANSAFGMAVLRMLAGRLNEAWKLLRDHRNLIEQRYMPHLSSEARTGYAAIHTYFDHPKPGSLIWRVRDAIAFHHDVKAVNAAWASIPDDADLGDYLSPRVGNTLFYTTEIAQYEALKHLAGTETHIEALHHLTDDTRQQTSNFNSFIYGFTVCFAEQYLPEALARLPDERESVPAPPFESLTLPYFFGLPVKSHSSM
jgi:hypothetical protein